ncbi:single-stranded DNA-binding protein [Patescibacteria group bacterium]|nr:single-stranded DNA-binding protein [Patescibacteria group bacterium]
MSSKCLNTIYIIGNVGSKFHTGKTKSNTTVFDFDIATNRSWLPKNATERREGTSWHKIITFSHLAELCQQNITKGTRVFVLGRLEYRTCQNELGIETKKIRIIAKEVIFLKNRKQKITESFENPNFTNFNTKEIYVR